MRQAGSAPDRIAEVLAVPVDRVERSLRLPASEPVDAAAQATELGPVLVVGERRVALALPRPVGWRAAVFVEDDLSWPRAALQRGCVADNLHERVVARRR